MYPNTPMHFDDAPTPVPGSAPLRGEVRPQDPAVASYSRGAPDSTFAIPVSESSGGSIASRPYTHRLCYGSCV
jgi:hypothetical protein